MPAILRGARFWLLLGRIALAAIFLAAGIAKLREPWLQFAVSINSFKFVPDNLLEPIARGLPWLEVVVGVAVLSGIRLKWTSLLATAILGGFLALLLRSWALGLDVDCGCFGSGEPLGPKAILRDSLMVALGLAVTVAAWLAANKLSTSSAKRLNSETSPQA